MIFIREDVPSLSIPSIALHNVQEFGNGCVVGSNEGTVNKFLNQSKNCWILRTANVILSSKGAISSYFSSADIE